jgi:hypothetical protein
LSSMYWESQTFKCKCKNQDGSRKIQRSPAASKLQFPRKTPNNPYTLGATTWNNLGKLGGHFTHQDNFITTIHEGFGNLTSGRCEKVWRVAKGQWFDFTFAGRKCGLTRRPVIHKSTVCTHLTHKITDYGIYNNHLRVLCRALIQILISLGQESQPHRQEPVCSPILGCTILCTKEYNKRVKSKPRIIQQSHGFREG